MRTLASLIKIFLGGQMVLSSVASTIERYLNKNGKIHDSEAMTLG